jgi:hypothetical protein
MRLLAATVLALTALPAGWWSRLSGLRRGTRPGGDRRVGP